MRIKPGKRIGLHFASNSWVHLGCLVRSLAEANAATDELNRRQLEPLDDDGMPVEAASV